MSMFVAPQSIVLMETHSLKFATKLVPMQKLNLQKGFMEPKKVPIPSLFYLLPFSFYSVTGLLGCASLAQYGMQAVGSNVTPIQQLKTKKNNSSVYLQGKIERQVPLLQQQKVYQLSDSTGKIWVLTKQNNVQVKDQVLIKGVLRYKSIPLGGKETGELYVEEQQQLEHRAGN
jgi:uncharacterized protein YdeI (BOF family)